MKQYRGLIILVSAMTLLFVLLQVWHAQSAPEEKKQERERKLKDYALTMNAVSAAAKRLDEPNRLESVTYRNEIMHISYKLTEASNNQVYSNEFTANLKALAATGFCGDKILGPFVSSGLLINFNFVDSNDSPIVNFQIGKSDCP